MNCVSSFSVNHDTLEKGMYISRIDGDIVTYDIRMKKPNAGDYLSNGAVHTFEHLLATCMRSGVSHCSETNPVSYYFLNANTDISGG